MENNKKKVLVPKLSLGVRVLVGGYLLYTSYGLAGGLSGRTGKDLLIFGGFTVFFTIVGLFLIVNGGWHFYKGEYIGGKADVEVEETVETTAVETEETPKEEEPEKKDE